MNLGWFEPGFVVKDLAVSVAFYEKLGFAVAEWMKRDGGGGYVAMQKGACRIGLFESVLDPSETQLIFYFGDVPALADALQAKGFAPAGPLKKAEGGASVSFRDPDGQMLFFINLPNMSQRTAQGAGLDLGWFEPSLPVKDIRKTLDFYLPLGFTCADAEIERGFVTIESGNCRMTLFQDHLDPPRLQLLFWQGDVNAIVQDLQTKGVTFASIRQGEDGGRSAMTTDPDGNPVGFFNLPHVVKLTTR
jgi:predicted enzyme related to lactoylglutathione lyase